MAHFAEIDDNSIVLRVVVTDNNAPNEGYDWLIENLGGRWVQTSYTSRIRKHFAVPGYSYNESLDAFIPPKPYESWVLNEETCLWEAPAPRPEDDKIYYWNEDSLTWIEA